MSLTTGILLASVLTFVVFNIFPVYKFQVLQCQAPVRLLMNFSVTCWTTPGWCCCSPRGHFFHSKTLRFEWKWPKKWPMAKFIIEVKTVKTIKIRSEWSMDAIKTYIMSSDWSSCPLIGHHALLLVIMPSDRSSCPLIDYHVLWLAFMSSDWLSCPMIGHHALLLVIMPSDWSS